MIRTFDGSSGGRNDYAKYTLTSYNENRPSGFFGKYNDTKSHNSWPDASVGTEYKKAKAGHHNGDYDRWYWTCVTFNYEELAELREKTALKVTLEVEATLDSRVDVDMKQEPGTQSMVRCDRDGNPITATKLGAWNSTSPNYVSRTDGVCTFDLTNDTGGAFAGVPRYGYCWGRNIPGGPSYSIDLINEESPLTTEKRAKLYVVTNERQSTLTFDACGGTGAPASVTDEGPEGVCTVRIPDTVPAKSGVKFNGWATEWLSPAVYHPGDMITLTEDMTLYADWEPLIVYLKYLPGEGGTGNFDVTAMPGYQLNVVDTNAHLKKPGKMISGYSDTDGGEQDYDFGDRITMGNADKTLYAVWVTAVYTVSYNANGGTGAPASQTKGPGGTVTLSATEPHRTGYQFSGWATYSGGPVRYMPGDVYTADESCRLYAVWAEEKGVLRLATHGGVKEAVPYIMTEDGLVQTDAFIMTGDGLKKGR